MSTEIEANTKAETEREKVEMEKVGKEVEKSLQVQEMWESTTGTTSRRLTSRCSSRNAKGQSRKKCSRETVPRRGPAEDVQTQMWTEILGKAKADTEREKTSEETRKHEKRWVW